MYTLKRKQIHDWIFGSEGGDPEQVDCVEYEEYDETSYQIP